MRELRMHIDLYMEMENDDTVDDVEEKMLKELNKIVDSGITYQIYEIEVQ